MAGKNGNGNGLLNVLLFISIIVGIVSAVVINNTQNVGDFLAIIAGFMYGMGTFIGLSIVYVILSAIFPSLRPDPPECPHCHSKGTLSKSCETIHESDPYDRRTKDGEWIVCVRYDEEVTIRCSNCGGEERTIYKREKEI